MKGAKKIMKIRIHNLVYGVPITFLNKYSPEQFEIVELGIANLGLACGIQPYKPHQQYRKEVQRNGKVDEDLYMVVKNGHPTVPYARILIRKKVGICL